MNYYNEIDPFAASWLRELIKAGAISEGEVDERSIEDVVPSDLRGFKQCHFFAGIGVWSHALRQAGFSDDRECWTGSCPCQPFSAAGKRTGTSDERHLWPAFYHLLRQNRPSLVFGEQVASKDGLAWLDIVQADLEGAGYSSAAVDLCAAGFGAPHIRQRLYFMAYTEHSERRTERQADGDTYRRDGLGGSGNSDILGNSNDSGSQRRRIGGDGSDQRTSGTPSLVNGFWSDTEWIYCTDQKYRPTKPGIFPLAHGVTNRVGLLRGAGNAIVAPVAAAFISSYLDVERERERIA